MKYYLYEKIENILLYKTITKSLKRVKNERSYEFTKIVASGTLSNTNGKGRRED
jgi:hypothetical protein